MKKRVVFLFAAAVAGCTVAFSGCASKSATNLIALSSNWYALTTYKGIQPTFTEGNENFENEKLTYSVTYTAPESGNSSYSVSYADGTYTTEFYAVHFDAQTYTYADYRAEYTQAGDIVAYYYRTELNVPSVTFRFGDETYTDEGDSLVTECYFLSCNDYLRPLYSHMAIKSTTPKNYQAVGIGDTYTKIDYEYTFYYNYAGTEVHTKLTDHRDDKNSGEKTQSLSAANALFDVTTLEVAVRAMTNLSASLSQNVSLFTQSGVQDYALSGANTALDDGERTALTALLKENGLYKSKTDLQEGEKDEVDAVAVSVSRTDGKGVSQTYWYAAIDNRLNNTGRATMLKLSMPLAYGLGTRTYTLTGIDNTLWNE